MRSVLMMVGCCGPSPNCWTLASLLLLLLLLVLPGYPAARFHSSPPDISYGMSLALTGAHLTTQGDVTSAAPFSPDVTVDNACCKGTLGYASTNHQMPYPCAKTGCCNHSETVAVIPVDEALGFKFVCMPKTEVKTLCYQAGSEVCTSNQDPDHVPRMCCQGARFSILLHRWYAAMTIKCVDQSELEDSQR